MMTLTCLSAQNEHNSNKTKCVIGYLNSCLEHQKCVGISVGGRAGYCDCLEGYIDVEDGLGRQVSVSGLPKDYVVLGLPQVGHESHNECKISFLESNFSSRVASPRTRQGYTSHRRRLIRPRHRSPPFFLS